MRSLDIDDQLRQYYAGIELSPESLEVLRGLVASSARRGADERPGVPDTSGWRQLAIAASVAVIVLTGALLMLRRPGAAVPKAAGAGLSERLAEEVVARHGRCADEIVFRGENLASLLAQMGKTDFVAAVPTRSGFEAMKVRGAHYCVLDGQIAIHVVLVDRDGTVVSLFETKAGESMASLRGASHRLGRSDVELWTERGVLYAAAFEAPVT